MQPGPFEINPNEVAGKDMVLEIRTLVAACLRSVGGDGHDFSEEALGLQAASAKLTNGPAIVHPDACGGRASLKRGVGDNITLWCTEQMPDMSMCRTFVYFEGDNTTVATQRIDSEQRRVNDEGLLLRGLAQGWLDLLLIENTYLQIPR